MEGLFWGLRSFIAHHISQRLGNIRSNAVTRRAGVRVQFRRFFGVQFNEITQLFGFNLTSRFFYVGLDLGAFFFAQRFLIALEVIAIRRCIEASVEVIHVMIAQNRVADLRFGAPDLVTEEQVRLLFGFMVKTLVAQY
ncbi:hypothetical protein IPC3_24995 [Pseudomonas aeruginosa]|nr:hypothetical protein Q046_05676 [Pseudomonas aeruginosa BWHPSA041]RPR83984.1 hypothetical protein IPC1038_23070 [Pseudomonas aeruginosa]RQJ37904.1 hypothetical protein IPC3_24995 [Pseudomonas aeruginosa]WBJ80008.1 hypothetical protein PALA50_05968 [Pseudomonas aeruginosa]